MQMVQCPNGHFYDASKTVACPYCQPAPQRPAAPQNAPQHPAGADGATVPLYSAPQNAAPAPAPRPMAAAPSDKTVAILKNEIGVDPVVGWLVCVEGSQKGRDFRLHSENNFIGRDPSMDVCIMDETITRVNHAILAYDLADGTFYISAAEGRSIIRHNGEALFGTAKLAAYDTISLGSTKLMFVPCCVPDKFSWK